MKNLLFSLMVLVFCVTTTNTPVYGSEEPSTSEITADADNFVIKSVVTEEIVFAAPAEIPCQFLTIEKPLMFAEIPFIIGTGLNNQPIQNRKFRRLEKSKTKAHPHQNQFRTHNRKI